MQYLIPLALALVVAAVLLRRTFKRVIVFEYERGVRFSRGRLVRILEPGAYWYNAFTATIQKLDLRPHFVSVAGQEILSADGVGLRISLAARYEVADPRAAIINSANYQEALYLELQLALREIVGAVKIDELLDKRAEIGAQLAALTEGRAAALGLRLLAVSVKDITFPGELKKIFAQVVKARQEGLAALERARGESAALRNLANAAKLLENNPALLHLRALQTLGEHPGNTVVLGMPAGAAPFPVGGRDGGASPGDGARSPEGGPR